MAYDHVTNVIYTIFLLFLAKPDIRFDYLKILTSMNQILNIIFKIFFKSLSYKAKYLVF